MYNVHRNHPLCLCSECVTKHETQSLKEPNTKYPDCSECSLEWNPILMEYCNEYCSVHQEVVVPTPGRRKADPDTQYAFTLTQPPDYKPAKPIEELARLIMTSGLTSTPAERASQWAFVKEYTEAGVPHIHGVYKTRSGRRIEQKYFKRFWKIWDEKVPLGQGHKGGYHAKARNNQCYAAYMEKEGEVVHSPPE